MSSDEILYILPYLISLLITSGVFLYSWKHHYVRGAATYTWFVAGQALTILGFILELISPNLQTKIQWDIFQWITDTTLVFFPFVIFATEFTDTKFRRPRLTWSLLAIPPIAFMVVLFTDSVHHLIYPNPHLIEGYPFAVLGYDFTYVIYLYALIYVYGYTFYGIGILFRRAFQPHNLLRQQFLIVAIGFSIPIALSVLALFGIKVGGQRDISPLTFAIGNAIVAWGLFRYGLFEIVPIARERIVEEMRDPVIVLDSNNRVVDINHAALIKFDRRISDVIGFPATILFEEWPVIVNQLGRIEEKVVNIESKSHEKLFYYELIISPLIDRRKRLIGQIIVVHDITQHKILEDGYKQLSEKLEQRVRERAAELVKSEEKFAKAFKASPTIITITQLNNGRLLEVNDAFVKIMGYTREEAIGKTTVELGIWKNQEVRDQLMQAFPSSGQLRNEEVQFRIKSGKYITVLYSAELIELDSRKCLISTIENITERKQAEEALRESEAIYRKAIEVSGAIPYRQSYTGKGNHIKYDFVGEGICQMTGYAQDEFNEAVWDSLVKESQLVGELAKYPWGEAIRRVRTGASPIWQCEHRILTRTGEIRWIYEAAVELRDEDGISHGSIGLYQDISERKSAEENLAEAYDTTLEGWAKALELRDKETEGHSRRVTETTLVVARVMGFSEEELVHIRRGSILHDIGKMGIPDDILRKAGPLTEEERQIVIKHPDTAYDLLKQISFLEKALEIPHCHHEKWDGTGYPRGLKGDEIPLSARIFAIADVWDALSYDRPYRNAWDQEKVTQYLRNESGKHFDPQIVKVFLELLARGEI